MVVAVLTATTAVDSFADSESTARNKKWPTSDLSGLPPEQLAMLQKYAAIPWQSGPTVGEIGDMAQIEVPEGYMFTGASGAQDLLELYGNPRDPGMLAAIVSEDEDSDWTLIFQFDEIGYVDDSDRDSIDAGALMSAFRASIEPGNQQRRQLGLEEMSSMDWQEKPFYDGQTNNLTWALKVNFPSGSTINYDIRLLGRRGVMEATLLADPETYAQQVPEVKQVLANFSFTDGNKYSQWTKGDKVAAVGLTGLIAGGGMVAAAKTGLLAKIGLLFAKGGKAIIIGVIVFFGAIASFIKRLFGGGDTAST